MAIRGKRKLLIDADTLQRVLDECYTETNDLKIELSNLYTIWNSKVVDIGEIAAVGKDVVKLLDQRDKLIDKKLKVAQQIHTIMTDRNKEAKAFEKENGINGLKPVDAMLPADLDDKITEMIQSAKNRNN